MAAETEKDNVAALFDLNEVVVANGIVLRVATVRGFPPTSCSSSSASSHRQSTRPFLIILLHGWPEGWFAWRNQLKALSEAGYAVCAPDMRGFGGSTSGRTTRDYRIDVLCADVLAIGEAFGFYHKNIVPIGHDFGAYVAWHLAWLFPERVLAVCGMAVPFLGPVSPAKESLLVKLQKLYGNPSCLEEEQRKAKFHYILHHTLTKAAQEYDRNCYEALYRLYFYRPGVPSSKPNVTSKLMFPANKSMNNTNGGALRTAHWPPATSPLDARHAPGLWARLPRPHTFPSWCSPRDFQYMVHQYHKSGFEGGLHYYKVLDENWHFLKAQLHQNPNKLLSPPAMYICGLQDTNVLNLHGGFDNMVKGLRRQCGNVVEIVALPDTGHWMQLERATEVNEALLRFLERIATTMTTPVLSKL